MKNVSHAEWRWVAIASCLLIFLARLPYLTGYIAQTDELRFADITVAPADNLSYLAKMQQGYAGSWLFQLPYTAEPHEGVPNYFFYLFLGHVARWTGLSIPLVFHLAAIMCGLLLLLVMYYFIAQGRFEVRERRYSFALAGFSSGLGWLMMGLGELLSTDLTVPESNTFFTLMNCPHFAFSQSLVLIIFLAYVVAPHAWTTRTLVSSVAGMLLTLIHPFMLYVVFASLGLYSLWMWKREGSLPRQIVIQGSINLLAIAPLVWMMYHANYSNPVIRAFQEQTITASPHPIYYLTGYGLLLPVAIIGIVQTCRRASPPILQLLVCWVLVAATGLYLPLSFQRRFSAGLHLPLVIFAGIALLDFLRTRVQGAQARRWARAYLLATYPTNLVLIILFAGGAALKAEQIYLSADEDRALAWIASQAEPGSVVLSSTELGAFVPAKGNMRSVSGHDFETLRAEEVKAAVKRFYSPEIPTAARTEMLCHWHVDYIVVGPRERALGASALSLDVPVVSREVFGEVEVFSIDPSKSTCL